jgi:hypothetical protein
MNNTGFEPPKYPFDAESVWLNMQALIQKRISNPQFVEMEDYLKPHLSQDDFNFLCEMIRIKEDFSAWKSEYNLTIDSPYIFSDVNYLTRWRTLTMIRYHALGEELGRLTVTEELKMES